MAVQQFSSNLGYSSERAIISDTTPSPNKHPPQMHEFSDTTLPEQHPLREQERLRADILMHESTDREIKTELNEVLLKQYYSGVT